jgi:hypothetical protein
MNKAEALDKIEQLAYSYDKGKIESMRDAIDSVLEQYAQYVAVEFGIWKDNYGDSSKDSNDKLFNEWINHQNQER